MFITSLPICCHLRYMSLFCTLYLYNVYILMSIGTLLYISSSNSASAFLCASVALHGAYLATGTADGVVRPCQYAFVAVLYI